MNTVGQRERKRERKKEREEKQKDLKQQLKIRGGGGSYRQL